MGYNFLPRITKYTAYSLTPTQQNLKLRVKAIQRSWKEYGQLSREEGVLKKENQSITSTLLQQHQSALQAGAQTPPGVEKTFNLLRQDSLAGKNNLRIEKWLQKLFKWSLKGYQQIIDFRNFLMQSNQTLTYHVMNANKTEIYHLTEEQYIDLLTNSGGMRLGKTGWSRLSIDKPIAENFKLSVGDKKLDGALAKTVKKYNIQGRVVANDALYQYLQQKDRIKRIVKQYLTKGSSFDDSALFELYDQIKYSMHDQKLTNGSGTGWARNADGTIMWPNDENRDKTGFFFSEQRRVAVDNFIKGYYKSGLDHNNTAFYKTGDSIKNDKEIIENKIDQAGISVSTIKNAIRDIAQLKVNSTTQLIEKLTKMFTYAKGDGLANTIQKGAKNTATQAIKNTIESIGNVQIFLTK